MTLNEILILVITIGAPIMGCCIAIGSNVQKLNRLEKDMDEAFDRIRTLEAEYDQKS